MQLSISLRNCTVFSILFISFVTSEDSSVSMLSRVKALVGLGSSSTITSDTSYTVVVIGGGLAGISAAIEAYEAGATVHLFDKAKNLGGNSAKATSGISASGTPVQRQKSIEDSSEIFSEDILKSGGGLSLPTLVDAVSTKSSDAIDWLMSNKFNLTLTQIAHCGGHSAPRTHRLPPLPDGRPVPVGFTTIKAVQGYLASRQERVNIILNARVSQLLTNPDGSIRGVQYIDVESEHSEEKVLLTNAVVLATGGYAFDRSSTSLLSKYAPDKIHLATTSGPQATGDGVHLAEPLGAKLVDMDQIQVHPTALVDPKEPMNLSKFLGPETMRGEGGILIDGKGHRFVNELDTRSKITAAIFEFGTPAKMLDNDSTSAGILPVVAYLIMNSAVAEKFGLGMLGFYEAKGLVRKFENVQEASAYIGAEPSILSNTLAEYESVAKLGVPDQFGKVTYPVKEFSSDEVLYVAIITPAIHYTMGGIAINEKAEVLRHDETNSVIPGLYAAGEVSGGLHGANRLAGNSLLECVVMGRIAGKQASVYARKASSAENLAEL